MELKVERGLRDDEGTQLWGLLHVFWTPATPRLESGLDFRGGSPHQILYCEGYGERWGRIVRAEGSRKRIQLLVN